MSGISAWVILVFLPANVDAFRSLADCNLEVSYAIDLHALLCRKITRRQQDMHSSGANSKRQVQGLYLARFIGEMAEYSPL